MVIFALVMFLMHLQKSNGTISGSGFAALLIPAGRDKKHSNIPLFHRGGGAMKGLQCRMCAGLLCVKI